MTFLARLRSLLRNLFRRERVERELDDEVRAYAEQLADEKIAAGMNPEQARREARLELGGVEQVKEEVRGARSGAMLDSLWQDVRFGARMLRKNPGFTAVAALNLALGIGASTAIFSVVNPILFESLPYPHPARMVMIWDFGEGDSGLEVTFGTYRELAERSRSFDALAVMRPWQPTATGAGEPERLDGQRVSAGYLRALGVPPAMGGDFTTVDDQPNGPRVVILSHILWQRRFGADPSIVGRQVMLDGEAYEVIAVMPATFENVLSPSAEVWAPLQYDMSQGRAWGHHLRMVGRLRSGVGPEEARVELAMIARARIEQFPRPPWAALGRGLMVNPLQDDVTRGARPALLAVLGAVVLVLAIACVNVTNLVVARGARRRGEFAMRAALGAGRARIARQLLTESLLLATLGGLLGMAVAEFGVSALVALSPAELPRIHAIRVDGAVFAFSLGLTTLMGLAVGVIPALHATRGELRAGLQQAASRATGGHHGTRSVFVVAEVALTIVVLFGTGLLVRSMHRLLAIHPGFDPEQRIVMQIQTSGQRFDKQATDRFFSQTLEAVRRVPGVTSAGLASQFPLSGDHNEYGVQPESSPDGKAGAGGPAFLYSASPGYLETMGIPLRRGRLLDARDTAGAVPVALVSESLARELSDAGVLGRRVHVGPTDAAAYTIVGVVGDVKQTSLAADRADAVYVTPEQWRFADSALWLVVRSPGDAAALAPAVRDAIWSVDRNVPVLGVTTVERLVAASEAQRRFTLTIFQAFALAALTLVAVGIYGVLAANVADRTREIAVRAALGAPRGSILALVVRQCLILTGIGAAVGLAVASMISATLTSLLFGVSPLDPATYAGVIVLIGVLAAAAAYVPARRALAIHPADALRAE